MELWTLVAIVVLLVVAIVFVANRNQKPPPEPVKFSLGDVTLDTLRYYCGYDYMRPILVAVKGKVYDVSRSSEVYAPGKQYHLYSGRECSRALAKASLEESDCCDRLDDLESEELQRLSDKIAEFELKYDVVGQVVVPKQLTLEQLAQHDGGDDTKPLYLAIQGTVYDITKGKHFYGPDGIYPFAGKEVARAFALLSTEISDCHDDLKDLSPTELDNLREWTAKFNSKYPIIGKIIKP